MGFIKIVRKAIRWLVVGIRGLRKNRELTRALLLTVVTSEKVQKRIESFFTKIAKVEAKWGMHSDFWRKIKEAAKAGTGVTLTPEDVRYAHYFKRAFDDTIKPIGKKVVDGLGLDGVDEDPRLVPLPDVPDVPELTAGEEDDGNLDLGDDFEDPTKDLGSGL